MLMLEHILLTHAHIHIHTWTQLTQIQPFERPKPETKIFGQSLAIKLVVTQSYELT